MGHSCPCSPSGHLGPGRPLAVSAARSKRNHGCARVDQRASPEASVTAWAQSAASVGVLQIIRGADPMLGITAVLLSSSREPGPSPAPPPVAEREPLFEATPIWLRADRKPKASGSGFEIRVADRSCHFLALQFFGEFLGSIRGRTTVYHDERKRQQMPIKYILLKFA